MITIKKQYIALYTLIKHEYTRIIRIASQVFIPPIINSALYILIFGTIIGKQIGLIDHNINYSSFITPGLIIMSVIINSYNNVSSSLFNARFQKNIEEILVSPMSDNLLLIGYTFGGILRGMIVSILVYIVSCFFYFIPIKHPALTILIIILVSSIFSLTGFTNALLAKNFDDITIIPNFFLTPLTYLGGIFYTSNMLSNTWKTILHINPIFYMIKILRYAITNSKEKYIDISIFIICIIIMIFFIINKILLKKGIGLRN
ncbi:ABC transporter permease [Candidatus Legionella polyplacis]|uniref:Transport permease protein n=1 Tax=Candidatus Legionella polyplacis TaxID=2005262 RepID=A0ABZ2GYQ9_9GAMM